MAGDAAHVETEKLRSVYLSCINNMFELLCRLPSDAIKHILRKQSNIPRKKTIT